MKIPKSARVTGADRVILQIKLRADYTAGASVRSIADDIGRSYGFVHRILVGDRDFTLRGRGGSRPAK